MNLKIYCQISILSMTFMIKIILSFTIIQVVTIFVTKKMCLMEYTSENFNNSNRKNLITIVILLSVIFLLDTHKVPYSKHMICTV